MGACLFVSPSAPRLPSFAFYQPLCSGANYSKVSNFEGRPLSSYTLEIWGNVFQGLEAESHHKTMMSSEGIKIAKG